MSAVTTSQQDARADSCTAPFTLRFTEWRCGHHGQRPADIPVHSVTQAQLILQAIGNAISQSGHARAALFDAESGTTVYITDDHADPISPGLWPMRQVVYHGTQAEIDELLGPQLKAAWQDWYGSAMAVWDGSTYLEDLEVITRMSVAEIEAATAPVEWHEERRRRPVCEVPPMLKPAAVLLAELRDVAADLAEEGGETDPSTVVPAGSADVRTNTSEGV